MYLVGVDERGGIKGFTFIRPLTAEEVSRYRDGVQHLGDVKASLDLLPLVQTNFAHLAKVIDQILVTPGSDLMDFETRRTAGVEVNRLLANFLSSARLFLDHSETRLARRYGRNSEEFRAFKDATAAEFDSRAEYRIMSKLRNYIQHCGMPLQQIAVSSRYDPDTKESTYRVAVELSVEHLLSQYNEWGKARADLTASAEDIPLKPLLAPYADSLERIEAAMLRAEKAALHRSAEYVAQLLAQAGSQWLDVTVATKIDHDAKRSTFKFLEPPRELLVALGVARYRD